MSKVANFVKQRVITPLLERYVGFWDGDKVRLLKSAKSTNHDTATPKAVIIGRTEYIESVQQYPVKDSKELLLMLDQKHGVWASHWIGSWSNGQRVVRTVTYKNSVQTLAAKKPIFVIPESWVLSQVLDEQVFAYVESFGHNWFIRKFGQSFNSIVENKLTSSEAIARAALGVPDSQICEEINQDSLLKLLQKGLAKLPLNLWPNLRLKNNSKKQYPLQSMAIAATAVAFVYLLAATAYLSLSKGYLDNKIAEQSVVVDEKLALRQSVSANVNKIESLNTLISGAGELINVWDVIGVIYQRDVRINNLQTNVDQIELSGVAGSATQLAADLRELPLVESVELTSPVRRGQNGDVFDLLISLRQKEAKNG